MAYIGNSPGVASQRVVTTFTATAGQTTFTPSSGYTLGYCDVFFNGVKLVNGDDYTAADGVSVVLASAAAAGDSVEIVAHFPRGLSDGYLKSEADALLAAKQNSLGYTPVNKAGDTMTGLLRVARGNQAQRDAFQVHVSGGINDGFYDAISWYQGSDANTLSATLASLRTVYTNGGRGELEWWSRQEIEKVGGSPYLRVDQHGRVTTPFQPAFFAYGGGISTPSDGSVLPFNSVVTNRGSHFNTSTRRFTAPVSGMYMLTMRITPSGSGTGTICFLRVNGSALGGFSSLTEVFTYNSVNGYHTTSSVTAMVSMNAGDYADTSCVIYNSSSNSIDFSRSSFGGYLIG